MFESLFICLQKFPCTIFVKESRGARRGFPASGIINACEPPNMCWELNQSLLKNHWLSIISQWAISLVKLIILHILICFLNCDNIFIMSLYFYKVIIMFIYRLIFSWPLSVLLMKQKQDLPSEIFCR